MTTKRAESPLAVPHLAMFLAAVLAVVTGSMVLAGWAFDITTLKSILPGWVSMKPNAALAFILTGIALLHASPPPATQNRQLTNFLSRLARVCGVLAGLIGLATLAEYAFDWNPGIDQWLFPEPAGAVGTLKPGRMAPDTALCFVLLAALWISSGSRKTRWTSLTSVLFASPVAAFALLAILSSFTPGIGDYGWGGFTPMAMHTAALFVTLGVAVILGAWRNALGPNLTRFSRSVSMSTGLVVLLAMTFVLYVRSENQIEQTNDLRYRSFLLADELRQSGDDLTRMARTYVVTGDTVYKKHFQEILDIRDGKKPRPENYWRPYWDLVLPGGPPPRPESRQAIALLDLMRQARFTDQEFAKLAQAKANSDALTLPEFEAMKLVESTGPQAEANRAKARMIMHDPNYHQAKVAVMEPIHEFFVLVDERTLNAVRAAENGSTLVRYLFVAFGLGLMFSLWRTYVALGDTLGGSVDEVYAHIANIGSGDFSPTIKVNEGLKDSVLGWLSETQAKLSDSDRERKRAEEALRTSEERFRIAAETANDVVYEWDLKQSVQWLGKIDEMLAYAPGEFPRTLDGWTSSVHPEDIERTMTAVQDHLEGRGPYVAEYRVRRKDGVYRWWTARGAVARTLDGTPVRWIGSITDITKRKLAEEEIHRLNADLELRVMERTAELTAVNKELNSFAYSVSHDLRAPLRSIDGFAKVLEEDYAALLDEDGRDALRRVQGAAQRMGELIDDLLNLSRLTRMDMNVETVDLSALACSVAGELTRSEPGRSVTFEIAPKLEVRGDRRLLAVLFENLLGNAWKFTSKHASARIELGVTVNNGEPAYFVRDDGVGFDMAHAANLFAPFQRLHSVSDFPGTGIGLATVRRIVQRHGGRVWAEGTIDKGAAFYFTLPA